MKVILSLLLVCAVQSSLAATVPLLSTEYHIQPIDPLITETPIADRVNVIAMLQQLVNQAVELAMNTASTLQDYIVNMLQMFTDRLQDAQHNANKFLDDMQTNVNETLQRYGDVGNCVKDNIAMVQNVTTTARQDIENCVRDAQAAVIFLREDLQQYTNAIAENVARIQEIVSKCSEASSNSFDVAFCVIDHLKDIGESITDVVNDSKEGLKVAGLLIYQISGESQECMSGAIEKARLETTKILEVIQHCIDHDIAENDQNVIRE